MTDHTALPGAAAQTAWMMQWRGPLFVLIGLVLAIGQPIHALYFSGHVIAIADTAPLAPVPLSAAQSDAPSGPRFELDPTMSPVRVIAHAEVAGLPHMSARFDAVVSRDGVQTWRGPVLFAVGRDGARRDVSTVVHTFDIDRHAEWTVALVPLGGRSAVAQAIRFEVRRNVATPSIAIVVFAVAVALGGAFLLIGDLRAAQLRRGVWRTAPPEIA